MLELRQLLSTGDHHPHFLLKILMTITVGRFINVAVTQLSPYPPTAPRTSCVSSFPLNYVDNPKATEEKQTALFVAVSSELSQHAGPEQLPGIQPGCCPVHLLAALYQAPADWFTKGWPGVCCLLPWPHVGCQLPGSRCPVHLLAPSCFPCTPDPLLSGRWCPLTLFTFYTVLS